MQLKRNYIKLTAIASAALILIACSGGGGGGGDTTSSTGMPTVAGTVNGFGSVIVDGVRIDDSSVVASIENDAGTAVNTELKIGQSVEIEHDGNLKAESVAVTPQIKGRVDAVDTAAGTITMMGNTVLINTDPATGPITVFEAPLVLANVQVGGWVEIHGVWSVDGNKTPVMRATRVELEDSSETFKIRGPVSSHVEGSTTFKVGNLIINYQGARIQPTGAAITDGSSVSVAIPSTATFNGAAVSAKRVKVKDYREESGDKEAQLSGVINNLIPGAKTFTLNGFKIDGSQAKINAGKGFADLTDGAYVRIKGVFQSDGSVKATKIAIRAIEMDSDGEIELHGSILDYVSNADFTVRGVKIDASSAQIECLSGVALADNRQVEVEGALSADGSVKAEEVKCEEAEDGTSTVEREGTATTVNSNARTFVLAGDTKVQWTGNTLFVSPLTAETLDNRAVEVEGIMTDGILIASKIKLDD